MQKEYAVHCARGSQLSYGSTVEERHASSSRHTVLPGNAVAHFTTPVILMSLLPHWFIQVTIRHVSRNF